MIHGRLPWPLVFQLLSVVAAVWLIVVTWQLWLLVFIALIIAAAILPAARLGERYRVPRGVTVLTAYVLVLAVMALVGRLLWPALTLSALAALIGGGMVSRLTERPFWRGAVRQLVLGIIATGVTYLIGLAVGGLAAG